MSNIDRHEKGLSLSTKKEGDGIVFDDGTWPQIIYETDLSPIPRRYLMFRSQP
jgi:hypothetical protein